MASSKEYLDFVLEQLDAAGDVTYRAMMGEYVLYLSGKVIGGVYDDRLLLKPTPSALRLLGEGGGDIPFDIPYPGAKEMLVAPVDDPLLLGGIVRAIAEELPDPGKKRRQAL